MIYKDYKDIPAELRRVILEETNETRVKNVSFPLCLEIIEDHFQFQKENEKLKSFTVEYVNRNGNTKMFKFKTVHDAFVKMDMIIGHGTKKRTDIMIALRQADRLIKGYVKGKYISPPPRDAIEIKKVTRYG